MIPIRIACLLLSVLDEGRPALASRPGSQDAI